MEIILSLEKKIHFALQKLICDVFFFFCFSDSVLELSVMPKDEDILQLVCLLSFFMKSCDLYFLL